jgi:hypothetical protein
LRFGFAEEATSAFGDATMSHLGWEDAFLGCLLDAVHGEMTKFEMVAHQEFVGLDFNGLGRGDLLLGLCSGEVTTDGMLGGLMSLGASRNGTSRGTWFLLFSFTFLQKRPFVHPSFLKTFLQKRPNRYKKEGIL